MAKAKSRSKGHFWGAADLWLRAIAWFARTGDDGATIDRFFVSRHVKDLRVIAAVASFFLTVGTLIGIALVILAHQHAPFLRFLTGQVPWDKAVIPWDNVYKEARDFFAFFAPALGVVGGVVAWAYKIASLRLGVVDLFACEIGTLCKVTTIVDAVDGQIKKFMMGPPQDGLAGGRPHAPAETFSSEENYFPVFESNARDLQALEADVVINITAFYTYMKSVRDTARKLAQIKPDQADAAKPAHPEMRGHWHDEAGNLIYMLFLGLEAARLAIDDLVEFEPDHAERSVVILISELKAYGFLRRRFVDRSDIRHQRIELRAERYPEIIRKLRKRIEAGMNLPDKYTAKKWRPAFLLLGELATRFDEAVRAAPPSHGAASGLLVGG